MQISTKKKQNKIKRRIKEIFRLNTLDVSPLKIFVVAKHNCLFAKYKELEKDFKYALKKFL